MSSYVRHNITMSKKRIYIATKGEYGGCKRQLAWFSRHKRDLYFDVSGLFMGSHTSYHNDGNIFRTSPISKPQTKRIGKCLPLNEFSTWYQFGTTMFIKETITSHPCLKDRNVRNAIKIIEVNLDDFPSNALNIVVELINPKNIDLLKLDNLSPPSDAKTYVVDEVQPSIVITILGHDHNLLIKPQVGSFVVSHFNSRFSTNRKDVVYTYEVIGTH